MLLRPAPSYPVDASGGNRSLVGFRLVVFRLLFVGDVVGEPGRAAVRERVPALREELSLDAVVVNGENSAPEGRGITEECAEEPEECVRTGFSETDSEAAQGASPAHGGGRDAVVLDVW